MEGKKVSELTETQSFIGLYTIGVDANGNSVKVSLDGMQDYIIQQFQDIIDELREEAQARPTGVNAPDTFHMLENEQRYIPASLTPDDVEQNYIFILPNQNNGVVLELTPDGKAISGNQAGTTTAYLIPTEKTSLMKVIDIEVAQRNIRMGDQFQMIIGSEGNFRLT